MKELTIEQQERLTQIAVEARQWAYAPYSGYAVGAALLAVSGRIYDGVNIENAAYPDGICAERVAIFKAVSGRIYDGVNIENAAYPDGICAERVAIFKAVSEGEREFVAIVIATPNGASPCGSCRQVLAEFGLDTLVLSVSEEGTLFFKTDVRSLLPDAFGPAQLNGRPK